MSNQSRNFENPARPECIFTLLGLLGRAIVDIQDGRTNCFPIGIHRHKCFAVRTEAEGLHGIFSEITSRFARGLTHGCPEFCGIHFRTSRLRKIGRISAKAAPDDCASGGKYDCLALARSDVDSEETHSARRITLLSLRSTSARETALQAADGRRRPFQAP